jgi:hypothetical protein
MQQDQVTEAVFTSDGGSDGPCRELKSRKSTRCIMVLLTIAVGADR